jgi:hypothetical protein
MIVGNLEELSLGAVDVMQPKTKGGALMREAGKYMLAYPLMFKGLYKLLGPGGWIARIIGMGAAGGTRSTVKQYFKKGEIDPKQVGIEAATWAGLQAVGEIGATAIQTKQAIDFISQRTGKPKAEVARFLARTFRNKFGKKFKAEPTAKNIELITNQNPEGVADVWKEAAETTKAMELKKPEAPRFEIEAPKPTVVPPEKPTIKPEVPKAKPEQVLEKDPLSEALLKDNRAVQAMSNLANKFDIERPFKKAGAPETGFRVKTYHTQINKAIEQGKQVQKEIKKLGLSKEQMADLVLASELKEPPKDPVLRKAYDIATKYFDVSLGELKRLGILKGGFIENQMDNIRNEIEEKKLELRKKGITSKQRRQRADELADLNQELDELKDLRFVSIPASLWFEKEAIRDPAQLKRIVKYQTKKRRKTLRIKDLVDAGVIKKENLNMNDIIEYYSRRLGRDVALGKIIESAKQEGLASLQEKKGYVKIPGYVAPELAKYWIHPEFANFISAYTQPIPMNWYDKFAGMAKGFRFYNPMFIPMYNIFQQSLSYLLNPKALIGMPRAYGKAIRDYFKKTPDYWQAYEDGAFSNPFVPESATLKEYQKTLPPEQTSPALDILKNISKLPMKVLKKFYDASKGLTWSMDQIQRMATTNIEKAKGLTPREAAQKAAQQHADYSKMPPRTRRMANRALLTPTFQSLMIRLPFTLLKNSLQIGKHILKGEKIPAEKRSYLEALLGMAAILVAYDQIMKNKGFKPRIWGYSYVRPDPDDPTKEQVVNFSNPFNVIAKWADVLGSPFFDKSEDRMFWKIIKRLKYRSAVPIEMAWELIENKKTTGAPIVMPGDSAAVKVGKIMDHLAGRFIAFYGDWIKQERIGDPIAQEKLKEEFGKFLTTLPLFFTYMRSGEGQRAYRKKVEIEKKMMSELYRYSRQGKQMPEKEKEKWRKAIREAK